MCIIIVHTFVRNFLYNFDVPKYSVVISSQESHVYSCKAVAFDILTLGCFLSRPPSVRGMSNVFMSVNSEQITYIIKAEVLLIFPVILICDWIVFCNNSLASRINICITGL